MRIRYVIFLAFFWSFYAYAETPPTYQPPPPVVTTEGMLQLIIGLLLVLAVIGAIVWLLKRFVIIPTAASSAIKIVATKGVGQRERIVLVEIGVTWLVLGVASGRVSMLHSMEKSFIEQPESAITGDSVDKFPDQLKQTLKQSHDQ